jgi:hypothetical protein
MGPPLFLEDQPENAKMTGNLFKPYHEAELLGEVGEISPVKGRVS